MKNNKKKENIMTQENNDKAKYHCEYFDISSGNDVTLNDVVDRIVVQAHRSNRQRLLEWKNVTVLDMGTGEEGRKQFRLFYFNEKDDSISYFDNLKNDNALENLLEERVVSIYNGKTNVKWVEDKSGNGIGQFISG